MSEGQPLRVLSLGAGVQSTTVLLMAIAGEIEPLDVAIFADTGWEPKAVYEHLAKLTAASEAAGVPIHRVTAGNIREDHVRPSSPHLFVRNPKKRPDYFGTLRVSIPLYTVTSPGPTFAPAEDSCPVVCFDYSYCGRPLPCDLGDHDDVVGLGAKYLPGDTRAGRTQRRCTSTYKVEPVEQEIRRLLGLARRQRWPLDPVVTQVFGISWDETERMRDSRRPAIVNSYPLIDLRMTRDDCHAWLDAHGWTAPRSACIGCPFHRNDEWQNLRDNAPDEFAEAVEFDHAIRAAQAAGKLSFDGVPYLHDQRVPLDEADLDEPEEMQGSLFGAECEGMCGI